MSISGDDGRWDKIVIEGILLGATERCKLYMIEERLKGGGGWVEGGRERSIEECDAVWCMWVR